MAGVGSQQGSTPAGQPQRVTGGAGEPFLCFHSVHPQSFLQKQARLWGDERLVGSQQGSINGPQEVL